MIGGGQSEVERVNETVKVSKDTSSMTKNGGGKCRFRWRPAAIAAG
jgi:hypothetical protein